MAAKEDGEVAEGLSAHRQQILTQFRERVSDVLQPQHDDHYLLRWLRARCFDLKKSEDMLRKNVAWKKKWQSETILDDWTPPDVLAKYYPGGRTGYDKQGAPVWMLPSGNLDMKGLTLSAKKSDILKYHILFMERLHRDLKQQSEKLGRRIDMGIVVNDLEGFTMKKLLMPGMEVLLVAMAMVEANYPESLKQCYIVNAPGIFPLIYKVVKPFMSEDTKKKITILDSKNWREELLKVIDADQLPQHWGGTQAGPDGNPFCQPTVCMAGDIPSSYYLMGHQVVDPAKVKKVTVSRRDSLCIPFNVTEVGQVIKWVFWTEGYDIRFGLRYISKQKDGERRSSNNKVKEVVLPLVRVNSHQVPEDDCFRCDHVGTIEVVFDNTYSWIHNKALSYSIELVNPHHDNPQLEEHVSKLADGQLDLG